MYFIVGVRLFWWLTRPRIYRCTPCTVGDGAVGAPYVVGRETHGSLPWGPRNWPQAYFAGNFYIRIVVLQLVGKSIRTDSERATRRETALCIFACIANILKRLSLLMQYAPPHDVDTSTCCAYTELKREEHERCARHLRRDGRRRRLRKAVSDAGAARGRCQWRNPENCEGATGGAKKRGKEEKKFFWCAIT